MAHQRLSFVMTDQSVAYVDPELEQYEPYRSVSKAGLGALALG